MLLSPQSPAWLLEDILEYIENFHNLIVLGNKFSKQKCSEVCCLNFVRTLMPDFQESVKIFVLNILLIKSALLLQKLTWA